MNDQGFEREIERRLTTSLRQLTVLDSYLLRNDANERSITHRLATYLEQHFDGWDVDLEFGGLDEPSVDLAELARRLSPTEKERSSVRDTYARTVFPDIVVHHRASGDRLLVVELKKSSSPVPDEVDRLKLRGYRDAERGYRFGCLVRVEVGEERQGRPPFRLEFL